MLPVSGDALDGAQVLRHFVHFHSKMDHSANSVWTCQQIMAPSNAEVLLRRAEVP